ncbi:MAG: Gfo/Idh/MocA family oxidoreductase [Acidobacteria bacterium]|nr:Gfo/Idh/MocA family oxidoreductase [Acidobacteriota bacterium]
MDNNKNDLTRRDFIKATGIGTAGLVSAPVLFDDEPAMRTYAQAKSKVIGANDRIRYGFIGQGGMGFRHMTIIKDFTAAENVEVVGICEIFEKRRLASQKRAELTDARAYTDYRKMLEDKDIDVIVIATPDHWHMPMAVEAMEAGKHIYLEKPMTHTLDEAFKIYDTAKRTNRWVQVGSHGCSDPKWHKAREIVKANRLGKVLWAQGSYCRNNPKGEWNYKIEPEATEQQIDWKAWLGNAPKRPFSAERYYRWRKYWDYGNGIIGDLWPHRLHPLMLAMSLNEFPMSASCMGGILCDTDKGYGEPREVADTTMVMVKYASGPMIYLAGSTVNERGVEDLIRGQKADLMFGGGKVQITPERPFVDEIEAKDETPPDSGESHQKHQKNFIDSLRANKAPNCDIELAVRVQAAVSMAEESYRKNKTVFFDPAKRKMRDTPAPSYSLNL